MFKSTHRSFSIRTTFVSGFCNQNFNNFEGGAPAEKKNNFLVKFFQKLPKNLACFSACFFLFCLRRRNFGQNWVFLVLWESSENQYGRRFCVFLSPVQMDRQWLETIDFRLLNDLVFQQTVRFICEHNSLGFC